MGTNSIQYSRHRLGREAENCALRYLKRQGLRLIDRNFRCRQGEIDLIMCDRRSLIFVEVRTRSHLKYGDAIESVSYAKQQRLLRAAYIYVRYRFSHRASSVGLPSLPICRFDIVAVSADADRLWGRGLRCTAWVEGAFSSSW